MTHPNSSNSPNTGPSTSTVYVCSHGEYPADAGTTFVPAGMRVVFYAREGEDLLSAVVGRILATLHKEGQDYYVGTKNGSEVVPNYRLGGFNDLQLAAQVQLAGVEAEDINESPRLYFVGGNHLETPIRLCGDPGKNGCRAPQHHCSGIFGVLKDFREIRFLCCRALEGAANRNTNTLFNDPDPGALLKITSRGEFFRTMIEEAPGSARVTNDPVRLERAEKYFRKLQTYDDIAELLTASSMATIWFEIYSAQRFHRESGDCDWALAVYAAASPSSVQHCIRQNDQLKNILANCRNRLETLGNEGPTPANLAWFHGLSKEDRQWLTAYAAPRRINEARFDNARGAGLDLTAFMRLQPVRHRAAVGRLLDPALNDIVIAIETDAQKILDRWNDPSTSDASLEFEWNTWPEEERYALQALAPDAVAAWRERS